MTETSNSEFVYTKQQRIASLARQSPQMGFTSLNHYLDLPWLREAYRRTRKDGAVGVDGQTAAEYEENLEANLHSLLNRAKSGTYFAPPVRRVHIPKGTGPETRPLGVPTLEDKVLQRAVVMILEAIYEQDFLDCSYGFRPHRSAHQALQNLWERTMTMGGCWILEVDIRKFFDTVDHAHLREFLCHRVRDESQKGQGVVKRKTASGRFARSVRAISQWCQLHRHRAISEQHRTLSQKLRGHYAYYGLTGNGKALSRFQSTVTRVWRKWLSRRKRGNTYPWSHFVRLLERFPLPPAVVVHSVYRSAARS
jgi:hypothetical protein